MSNYTFGEAKVLLYNPKDVMDDLQKPYNSIRI